MRLTVNSRYDIVSDERCFIVAEKRVSTGEKSNGDIVESNMAYLRTIEDAFKFLVDQSIRSSKATNLKDLVADVKAMKADIDEVLKVLK
jgi:hypothetical protein